jgi:hypothetical protein
MGWILFEAMLALAVMLVWVWWTFRGRADIGSDDAEAEPPADKP